MDKLKFILIIIAMIIVAIAATIIVINKDNKKSKLDMARWGTTKYDSASMNSVGASL